MSLPKRLLRLSALVVGLDGAVTVSLAAQHPVTRAAAIEAALARGARAAFGRADTAFAAGVLRAARAFPNPSLAATYTKDVPHYHYIADLALDLPGSVPPRPRARRRVTGSRSNAPPSGSTSTRPTPARSPHSRTRACRAAPRATPTACSRWPGCAVRSAT